MNDTSDRIGALKIDRETASPSSVVVETDTARRPPSIAAASSVLDASDYLVARRQATVSSKLTGKVEEVLVEEGMRVEKDQIVARLDDRTQQAQLELANARIVAARLPVAQALREL